MKTFKMFQTAVILTVLSILVGCSEQSTAPLSSEYQIKSQSSEKIDNSFTIQIRLKPNRSYVFNIANTGLEKFYAIDIQNSDIDCKEIVVFGDSKYNYDLSCHNKKFESKNVTIQNIGSRMIDLTVTLTGIRAKKIREG